MPPRNWSTSSVLRLTNSHPPITLSSPSIPARLLPSITQINTSPTRKNATRHASTSSLTNTLRSRTRPGSTVETYVAYGLTQKLYEACSAQADYRMPTAATQPAGSPQPQSPKTSSGEDLGVGESWWFTDLGLQPTFSTWSQVTFLHMYLLTARLRALPSQASLQTYSRHLIDHFSHAAEERMDLLHGISSRGIRNRYLKDLFIQWRGVLAAYDEGLVRGDAVLGAAVWRNLWKGSYTSPDTSVGGEGGEGGEVDWRKVAWVVCYMRRVLSELDRVDEADLIEKVAGREDRPGLFGVSEVDRRMVERS